jgi:hypothetical protein
MGKRTNKSWSAGNPAIGVRLEPEIMEVVEKAAQMAKETKTEYARRLILEDLKKLELI